MKFKDVTKSRLGIKSKTIASILIAGSVPLVLGLGFTYFKGTAELRKAIGSSFEGLAKETARKVDLVLNSEIEKARHLAGSLQVKASVLKSNQAYKGLSDKEIHKRLARSERQKGLAPIHFSSEELASGITKSFPFEELPLSAGKDPAYIALFITDKKGALVGSINQYPDYLNSDKPWFQKAHKLSEKQVDISDLYFHNKAQTYAIDMVMPITENGLNEPIGFLKIEYNLKEFLKPAIYPVRFGETGHAMLIDSGGNVLICPILPTGAHVADVDLVKAVTSPVPGWVNAVNDGHGGKNSIVGFSPLEAYNNMVAPLGAKEWFSFIRQDPKELYVPIQNLIHWISLSGILAMVLLGILGFYAANRIVNPIRKLQEGTSLIAEGKLERSLDIHTGDEIEQLAASIELMNRKLKEAFSGLELRVEDRTRELKESQAKLLHAEKLASMGEVAASIGHELRNPLSVIKNSAYYLRTKIKDDPKLIKHLNIVEKEVLSSERIISDLLNFTRSKGLVASLTDLHKLIDEALSTTEVPAGMVIEKAFDPQMVPLRVDSDLIRRVFINLITNAIQAMGDSGKLMIITRNKGDEVEFEFRDTGKGIPPEHIEKIFKPFFTTKAKGIGLGLAVSRKSILEHEGTIDVNSEVGKGTTFRICLPLKP